MTDARTVSPGGAPAPEPGVLARLWPIVFFQIYLNLSIAIFAFGPWLWPLPRPGRLYLFVGLAHLALLLGYLSAAFDGVRPHRVVNAAPRLLRWSIALTLILFVPTLLSATGGQVDLVTAFRDPAVLYDRFQSRVSDQTGGSSGIVTYLRLVSAPLVALLAPLLALRWVESSAGLRLVGVVAVLSNTSIFVLTGRNKGLVDLLLLLPWLVLIARPRAIARPSAFRVVLGVVALAVLGGGFIDYFTRNLIGRYAGRDDAFFQTPLLGGIEVDPTRPMVTVFPQPLQGPVTAMAFGQSHAYFALALALDKPFEPSWGVGHSFFLQVIEQKLTGRGALGARSYPRRLEREDGWDITAFWHTTYTWLASDLSFPGVIVAVFLLGRLLALTWLEARWGRNPLAAGLFITTATIMYYLPTNNIVLGFAEGMGAFWGLLVVWAWSRVRTLPARSSIAAPEPAPETR